ncbi:MAG: UDP-3-O-[3-hydroxymyristoyl] N-acetylglucosamine deacetylase [Phycisphaerae bacterium]|nr:UDP-3-O-[3-hydroxymyristoyl] N-acetylglucosamine deacetylase [Phycisphaerae bacterium]
MNPQKTIRNKAVVKGKGLFSGVDCRLQFCPAPEDTGIVFVRTDTVGQMEIPALNEYLVKKPHRTTSLAKDNVAVETIEHVMAAVWGMDIDNLFIEVDAEEIPSTDGSVLPFVKALQKAQIEEQDIEKEVYVLDEPVVVSHGETMLTALPGPTESLEILYDLEYECPSIGRQVLGFGLGKDDFVTQLASSRTFLLESEAQQFQAMGLGQHLTSRDVLVMGDKGPVDNKLRFADEHVRHKIVDLIGDLALLGRRFSGRVIAYRSGHEMNHELVQRLGESIAAKEQADAAGGEPVMDIRRIMRLLPHRYPFLMIDRIISIDGDNKAVGIKNVTINEPYFQGHYPNLPIMPGVMIVEAMAQLSGILLSRRLEHTGKVAVLLSMDRVKMRRPVRPGDQLMIEAVKLHARTRTGHCKCTATVGGEISAEAEIKFMLVDSEPV